jgi:hypothetical protein
MKRQPFTAALVFCFVFSGLAFQSIAEPTVFEAISKDYEAIRQALLNDTTTGVAKSAATIAELSRDLDAACDEKTATLRPGSAGDCRELMPTIGDAASRLTRSGGLAATREAFGDLSKSMVNYRQMVQQPESIVVYCSMAEGIWLQPAGEIGNPYYGQEMARCGQVVSE